MVACQKGPTCHAYPWQIGPFWQDTLDMWNLFPFTVILPLTSQTMHEKTTQAVVRLEARDYYGFREEFLTSLKSCNMDYSYFIKLHACCLHGNTMQIWCRTKLIKEKRHKELFEVIWCCTIGNILHINVLKVFLSSVNKQSFLSKINIIK